MNKQTLRFIVMAGLFLVPFIPFLVSSSLFFPFITTKAFAWRIIVELIFASWIILAVVDEDHRPKRSPLLYAVLAFLVVMGAATLFGVDPARSFWSNFERMEGYVTLLHLGAFFLVIGSLFSPKNWKKWWNTSLVASGLMVIYCLFQLGGVVAINQGGVRVDGTFGNASYLAVYMLVHIFVAGTFLWKEWRNSGLRWTYAALILGQIFILYHTATRGAILGLLGGLLIVAVLNLRNREENSVRKISVGIIVGLLVIVGGFFALRNSDFVLGSPVLSRFSSITTEELKSGGRSFVWPMALEGFKERPILGWGQDNFIFVFQKHYSPEMYHLEPWFDRAHNIFLDWMVAGGVLGLLSYLALYVLTIYLIWWRDEDMSYMEKSLLTGLLGAYFFHNFFVFDHLISYVLFFAIIAYVHGRNASTLLWQKSVSEKKTNQIVLPVVIVITLGVLYFGNMRAIGTNINLIKALMLRQTPSATSEVLGAFTQAYPDSYLGREEVVSQISSNIAALLTTEAPIEERNAFYAFAREVVLKEADQNPDYAKSQMAAGSFLSVTGTPHEAFAYLERAKALSPGKQQIYFEIGSAYISNDEPQKALEIFRQAYEMAPENREAKIIYLIGAIYAGDRNLERNLASQLPERDYVFEDRILSAYFNSQRYTDLLSLLEKRKQLDPQNSSTYDQYIKQVREMM